MNDDGLWLEPPPNGSIRRQVIPSRLFFGGSWKFRFKVGSFRDTCLGCL